MFPPMFQYSLIKNVLWIIPDGSNHEQFSITLSIVSWTGSVLSSSGINEISTKPFPKQLILEVYQTSQSKSYVFSCWVEIIMDDEVFLCQSVGSISQLIATLSRRFDIKRDECSTIVVLIRVSKDSSPLYFIFHSFMTLCYTRHTSKLPQLE